MAYQIVDNNGFFTIGTKLDPDSLFDGKGVNNASLSRETKTTTKQCIGDAHEQEDETGVKYQIQGDVTLPTTNTGGLMILPSKVYVTYKTQGATPTTLFAGECIVRQVGDRQSFGNYYDQSVTLGSTGAPDTPA